MHLGIAVAVALLATLLPFGAAHAARARAAYPVAETTLTFVDATRAEPAYGSYPGSPARTLVTDIFVPSRQRGRERFPLVVFAHGFASSPFAYEPWIRAWAEQGYVIAAPAFPETKAAAPDGPSLFDYVNQPADVSFVITQMLQLDNTPGSPVYHAIARHSIGVVGHSLGAITTLAVADNSCCHDPRVRAAVSLSGLRLPFGDGTWGTVPPTPLLVVHGTADDTTPYLNGLESYAGAAPPKYMLTLFGASHSFVENGASAVMLQTVSAFLDVYLKGHHNTRTIFQAGTVPGVASISGELRVPKHAA